MFVNRNLIEFFLHHASLGVWTWAWSVHDHHPSPPVSLRSEWYINSKENLLASLVTEISKFINLWLKWYSRFSYLSPLGLNCKRKKKKEKSFVSPAMNRVCIGTEVIRLLIFIWYMFNSKLKNICGQKFAVSHITLDFNMLTTITCQWSPSVNLRLGWYSSSKNLRSYL